MPFECPEALKALNTFTAAVIPHLGASTASANAVAMLNAATTDVVYACPPPLDVTQLRRDAIARLWTAMGQQRGLMTEEAVGKLHEVLEKLGDEPPPPNIPAYAPAIALFTPWGIYPWQPQNLPVDDDLDWVGTLFGEHPDETHSHFRTEFQIVWRDGWWVKLPGRSPEDPFPFAAEHAAENPPPGAGIPGNR
jgi:hypothetical protein